MIQVITNLFYLILIVAGVAIVVGILMQNYDSPEDHIWFLQEVKKS